jgi:hypothetical protein
LGDDGSDDRGEATERWRDDGSDDRGEATERWRDDGSDDGGEATGEERGGGEVARWREKREAAERWRDDGRRERRRWLWVEELLGFRVISNTWMGWMGH